MRGPGRLNRGVISESYQDAFGKWHDVSRETRAAILSAMGEDDGGRNDQPEDKREAVIVLRTGERRTLQAPAQVTLEDGTICSASSRLGPDIPLGYHQLRYVESSRVARLIVPPSSCYLPADLNCWGWSAQLYAARSARSWGIGDFGDLRRLARWSSSLGAGILLVNPLGASSLTGPQQPSPYYPSSRRFRNPLYLRIEEIPGARELPSIQRLAVAGRHLNRDPKIDRDAVFKLKMSALEQLWSKFQGMAAFEKYCQEQGEGLSQFATFCALAEEFGSDWHSWPPDYRHPSSAGILQAGAARRNRIRFHQWVQWLLDIQLSRAASRVPVMQDLPIGVDPNGADAWAWQDVFAKNVAVGAPPDEYNTRGQNWGLPPLVPAKLRRVGYEPFIQTIRAALRHAQGLRIDHVMGLFRLYWIPGDGDPHRGAYVYYPADDLLAILALESVRAKAYIVGEDLGTVEPSTRMRLARQHILSYRLVWFEKDNPSRYPRQALAAVTTHDLPTVAGLWSGADMDDQRQLGLNPNEKSTRKLRGRLGKMAGVSDPSSDRLVITRVHKLLAQAPSMIVTATLEDALAVKERPNMPGTTDEQWPNWSRALPKSLESLERDDLVRAVAGALGGAKRKTQRREWSTRCTRASRPTAGPQ